MIEIEEEVFVFHKSGRWAVRSAQWWTVVKRGAAAHCAVPTAHCSRQITNKSIFLRMNAIITGASRGIGRAVAETFAAKGFNLVLCARNEVALYKTMEEILTNYPGIEVRAKAVDMSEKKQVIAFGEWILEKDIF